MSEQRSKHEGQKPPAHLLDPAGPAARALAALDAQTESPDGDEDRAWRRLRRHLRDGDDPAARPEARPRPLQRWLFVTGAAVGLIIAVALTVGQQRPPVSERAANPISVDSSATTRAIPAITPPAPALPPSSAPRPLPAHRVLLDEHIAVIAAPGTKAVAWALRTGEQQVELTSGTIELTVSGRVHPTLVVHAGDYRFRDRGTIFEVGRAGPAVWLHVKAGAVAVSKGQHVLAVVRANQRWSSDVADPASDTHARPTPASTPATASAPAPAPAPAPALGPRISVDAPARLDNPPVAATETPVAAAPTVRLRTLPQCRSLEQGQRDEEAQTCLRALAEGNDLTAETALYELARVQRERLGDDAAALATLQKQRRRFPGGALRDEAELTTIELLPHVRHYRSALDLSESFLARHPRHQRAGELHLLRGNILREVFADHAAAVREYQEVDSAPASVADDAAFFLAVALEADGRRQDAADAYRSYLERRAPAHAAVARARLAALAR